MVYSQKIARKYALASFLLAVIELLIAIILSLEIASNACKYPSISGAYDNILIHIICHPFLELIAKPLHYAPVFTLWLVIVIPTTSLILAAFSFFRSRQSNWKMLSISGLIIHFLLLVGIVMEIKSEMLFLLR